LSPIAEWRVYSLDRCSKDIDRVDSRLVLPTLVAGHEDLSMISASVLPRYQNTYVQAIHALKSDEAERYVFAFSNLSRGELDLLGTVGTLDILKSN
jgi:hypothetical protein